MEKEQRRRAEKEALEQRKIDDEMREVGTIWKQYTCLFYPYVSSPPLPSGKTPTKKIELSHYSDGAVCPLHWQ